ncbi:hypothetical protein HMN09_00918100 [Mycena chlorophos]|uniref:Glycosyltransferase family 69 protein n=1 Tax=Mycena chlorophos TaxID=658473 RepID=A0A8H6W3H2_MYCCL|nr:hypothetical protein HMN09_00918100 [Mycena chlorophos]
MRIPLLLHLLLVRLRTFRFQYLTYTARHPRLFASLHPLLLFLLAFRIAQCVLLWWPRHVAHPEARTWLIALLGAAPLWAGWMLGRGLWTWASKRVVGGLGQARERHLYEPLLDDDAEDRAECCEPLSASTAAFREKVVPSLRQGGPYALTVSTLLVYLSVIFFACYLFQTAEVLTDTRFRAAVNHANAEGNLRREGYADAVDGGWAGNQRVFIGAMFRDNEDILPHWTREMLRLVNFLGPDNVFLSIVESHSSDNTPSFLHAFDAQLTALQVPHRIFAGVDTPRPNPMRNNPARIEYLAKLRNIVLEPLHRARPADTYAGGWDGDGAVARGRWDKVLLSNDVLVEAESLIELLYTREGAYDMVCGTDFQQWGLYDLWVIRDRLGKSVSGLYPYFLEPRGFFDVINDEPVEVFTCWNGVVALSAKPFLHQSLLPANDSLRSDTQLAFRSSDVERGECFSSESFNLPYDLRRRLLGLSSPSSGSPLSIERAGDGQRAKIFVNPRVVSAYLPRFYAYNKHILRHWLVRWWMLRLELGLPSSSPLSEGVREAVMQRWMPRMRDALFILGSPRPVRVVSEPVGMLPEESEGWECHQQPY